MVQRTSEQSSQVYGASPVCIRMWRARFGRRRNSHATQFTAEFFTRGLWWTLPFSIRLFLFDHSLHIDAVGTTRETAATRKTDW